LTAPYPLLHWLSSIATLGIRYLPCESHLITDLLRFISKQWKELEA